MTTESFRDELNADMPKFATTKLDPELWQWLVKRIYYVRGTFEDPEGYQRLKTTMEQADKECNTHGNYLHYLSTPPSVFGEVVNQLGAAGVDAGRGRQALAPGDRGKAVRHRPGVGQGAESRAE